MKYPLVVLLHVHPLLYTEISFVDMSALTMGYPRSTVMCVFRVHSDLIGDTIYEVLASLRGRDGCSMRGPKRGHTGVTQPNPTPNVLTQRVVLRRSTVNSSHLLYCHLTSHKSGSFAAVAEKKCRAT